MGYAIGTSGADMRSRFNLVSERIVETVRRKIVNYGLTLHRTLVLETPILTGQAKANWQAVLGQPTGSFIGVYGLTTNPRDRAHGPPQSIPYDAYAAQAETVINAFVPGQVLYIFSNLPYIEMLNNGSSRQAPRGFVESAVMIASAAVRR